MSRAKITTTMGMIMPRPSERALFLGMNGSGKTQAALTLLRPLVGRVQIDILDSKIEPAFLTLPGSQVVEYFDELPECIAPVRIYRPVAEELADEYLLDSYLQWRYENAPDLTYIDEMNSLGAQTKPKPGLVNLTTRGRSRQAALWMSSQRPAWISRFAFSETNRFYVFRLSDEDDRKRVVRFTTPQLKKVPARKYGFWYYHAGDESAYLFKPMKI